MPLFATILLVVWPVAISASPLQSERILVLKQTAGRDPETPSQQYLELLQGFEQGLSLSGPSARRTDIIDIYDDAAMNQIRSRRYRLIVCLGTKPAQIARDSFPDTPMVYSMVLNPGRQGLETLSPDLERGIQGGIQARIAPSDYLSQIRRIHPQARTIGMLYASSDFQSYTGAIIEEGKRLGVRVLCERVHSNRELIPKFKALMDQNIDLFLMLPDTQIFAKAHEYIFLEALRRKLPVMGPSTNYVKAGALWGVVLSPHDIGLQTARMMEKALANERLSIEYPSRVKLTFNYVVASKLGIAFPQEVIEKAKGEGRVVE